MSKYKGRKKKDNRSLITSMILIGAGLIIISIISFVLLSKPEPTKSTTSSESRSSGQPSAIPVVVNFPAPDLTLKDLEGVPISLDSYQGRVILVNNWATWCPPCKAEMPTLQAYYDAHRDQDFMLVAVNAGDGTTKIKSFVDDYGLTFDVLADPAMKTLEAFRTDGLPSSFVIDETGTVRLAWTGMISQEMLEKYVTPILEEKQ